MGDLQTGYLAFEIPIAERRRVFFCNGLTYQRAAVIGTPLGEDSDNRPPSYRN